MRKGITYSDAVRLLGQESKVAKVLGGALLDATPIAGVLSLFDVKDEVVRLGTNVAGKLRDRVTGLNRYDRTARLEAAHAAIIVAAFFQALDEMPLPFDPKELRLTKDEQVTLAGGGTHQGSFIAKVMTIEPAGFRAHHSYADTLYSIRQYYRELTAELASFVSGLAVRDRLNATEWTQTESALRQELPETACRKYEELHRQLAVDVPEFALWRDAIERHHLATGLGELEALLTRIAAQIRRPGHPHTLSRAHRAVLSRPIAQSGEIPMGMSLPTLAEAYVNPDFRMTEYAEHAVPSVESWWNQVEPNDDIVAFLARYLTSPEATRLPLVVLGQPGAGKSVLTRILAGRLPEGDYLPVRVPLREVPSDGTIQEQIEAAVRDAIGEQLSWPELVRSAGGALPVVMLDGLDELLQATGVHRSDYLAQIVDFQRRETELGRPVVMLVTTRTTVADRMRFPHGCLLVRLEPFTEVQVRRWLSVWNSANRDYFSAHGLDPLPAECVLAHGELASQPLLLLMLALYDTDGNALQRGETTLSQAELYERLLTRFARREVGKHRPGLAESDSAQAVELELRNLAVAAFAMFNRGRQWVTTDELEADLTALLPAPPAQSTSFQAPLSRADKLIGRFFFVHQASAVRDGASLHTYEFLHATFGEYLVARMVRDVLRSMIRRETNADAFFGPSPLEDGLLYALLSFSLLTERQPTLDFLIELLPGLDRDRAKGLLIRLLHGAETRTDHSYAGYLAEQSTFITRYAYYTANLVILSALGAEGIAGSELFSQAEHPGIPWQRLTSLWDSRLSRQAFTSLINCFQAQRTTSDSRDNKLIIRYIGDKNGSETGNSDPEWHMGSLIPIPTDRTLETAYFMCNPWSDALAFAAKSPIEVLNNAFQAWGRLFISPEFEGIASYGRTLIDLLMTRYQEGPEGLPKRYERALDAVGGELESREEYSRRFAALMERIDEDVRRVRKKEDATWLPDLATALTRRCDRTEPHEQASIRSVIVNIYRTLHKVDPDGNWLLPLARALDDLSHELRIEVSLQFDSMVAEQNIFIAQETVSMLRELTQIHPDGWRHDLEQGLVTQGLLLVRANRGREAAQALAEVWLLGQGEDRHLLTTEVTGLLRQAYQVDPEGTRTAFLEATGSELPAEVTSV